MGVPCIETSNKQQEAALLSPPRFEYDMFRFENDMFCLEMTYFFLKMICFCLKLIMCAHVCLVGAYMCVHGAGACGGSGEGEFVLVVGCMCVDGWWLRRVLSSLT